MKLLPYGHLRCARSPHGPRDLERDRSRASLSCSSSTRCSRSATARRSDATALVACCERSSHAISLSHIQRSGVLGTDVRTNVRPRSLSMLRMRVCAVRFTSFKEPLEQKIRPWPVMAGPGQTSQAIASHASEPAPGFPRSEPGPPPKSIQRRAKAGPKWTHRRPNVDPKSTPMSIHSRPKVDPLSTQSRPKVDPTSIQSRPSVDPLVGWRGQPKLPTTHRSKPELFVLALLVALATQACQYASVDHRCFNAGTGWHCTVDCQLQHLPVVRARSWCHGGSNQGRVGFLWLERHVGCPR